ncbi:arginine biosynthesis protein ArgJ [Antarctobacter heliothermus]|uniref:Arginine biosynthesis protein ArgJ n=1 Tax=Antarctobacter heliothermus TaxID=74033 RepID=A0A222E029_9RHOB|nr:VWA domain-containing protein [Antarctobacter heliothermus]ASP19557.1 arginine biosynthesis protein ArgJ [Antarctobacter heliothermus]
MSDDLDDLKRAFDAGLPGPDPDKRAAAIALAMKNFDRAQETADLARQTSEPTEKAGIFRGAKLMFAKISNRGLLTATTAIAAVAMVALIPVLQNSQPPEVTLIPASKPDAKPVAEPVAKPDVKADDRVVVAPAQTPVEPEALEETLDLAFDAPVVMNRRAADAGAAKVGRPMVAPSPQPMAPAGASRMRAPAPASPGAAPSVSLETGVFSFEGGAPATRPLPIPVPDQIVRPEPDTEAFPDAEDNPIKVTAEAPVSTFSIDVDTASWSMIRNSLSRGMLPPEGAVRIEEMVNYFTYDYPAPEGDAPFATHVGVSDSPWVDGTQIVHIGLQGMLPDERPPMNLVFLIDTSGSMNNPTKLPLLKQSFRLMLGQLGENDTIAIVTYAGSAGLALEPTKATERDTILAALESMHAGGSTAGQAGLQQAYATAAKMAKDGEEGAVSRVILATDGDFNVGISDPDALKEFIADKRDEGTYLSVLGFGRGNLDDATMQALAQTGNGIASYIDTLAEAQKVLVDQLTGALVPIANDVKIQVEWNPALVAEYRLIGYETRALKREDFNNDKVDAGEIGAGHQVTAIYAITPVGSPARMTDPLRYAAGDAQPVADETGELGFLRLRYKTPGEDSSKLIETPINADAAPLAEGNWALAIAGFGQILRGSDLIGDWSMGDAIALAQASKGDDPFGYRQEAITLMRLTESLKN